MIESIQIDIGKKLASGFQSEWQIGQILEIWRILMIPQLSNSEYILNPDHAGGIQQMTVYYQKGSEHRAF